MDADPTASLVTLVRRELIRPGEPGDPDGEGWSFRHGLIREVAYGSLPKWRRAELHERLAQRAIERGDADVAAGIHLYRAAAARREAGERGHAVEDVAARAAAHLRRAGLAAYESEDMASAVSLLDLAQELLPRAAPERVELVLKLAEAAVLTGELRRGLELFDEANALADELEDERLVARARLTAGRTRLWNELSVSPQELLDEVERVIPVLERAGDYEGLAIAEMVSFHALDRARLPNPEARLPIALDYARKGGAGHLEHHVMRWISITLPRGTVPVEEALVRARELHEASRSAAARASTLGAIGLLLAMQGEFDEARALEEEDQRLLVELGLRQAAAAHNIAIAEVEIMAGDYQAAERILRAGYEAVTALEDRNGALNIAWRLGLVLVRQGGVDEAERFALIAASAQPTGFWIDLWWRVVVALVESHRGAAERVQAIVDEVSRMLGTVDESGMHVDALLELAEALRIVGREAEAAPILADAARIAERLGYTVAARRAAEAQRALTA